MGDTHNQRQNPGMVKKMIESAHLSRTPDKPFLDLNVWKIITRSQWNLYSCQLKKVPHFVIYNSSAVLVTTLAF